MNQTYDRLLPAKPKWNWRWFVVWFLVFEAGMILAHLTRTPEIRLTWILVISQFFIGPALLPFLYYGAYYLFRLHRYLRAVQQALRPTPRLDIFISHSSKDELLAKALIELIEAGIPGCHIRCSSIDGYRLHLGEYFESQIRDELLASKALLGLITPHSLNSDYVMFELGARWGAGLWTVPLLAHGADSKTLPGPLKLLNAVELKSASQIHQLLKSLSDVLKIPIGDASRFQAHVERLQHVAANDEV